MRSSAEAAPDGLTRPRGRAAAIAMMLAAAYALTLFVFYPGVMTYDAMFVHEDIAKGVLGDWQSPVMTLLWGFIDPIAPGSASMFLLIATTYWLAFGLIAWALAARSLGLALALLAAAALPPAFVFVGIIWRDVLFAAAWLMAAGLAFVFGGNDRLRVPAQAIALVLLAFGILIRPNAIVAAAALGIYIIWPRHVWWKRVIVLLVPGTLASFALVQIVYYGVLGATRQNPLHPIMVFDLGGITHFTRENQFPVTWTAEQTALLTDGCWQPTEWDIYWRFEPCRFVMERLERDKLFGSSALVDAWRRAILHHPLAYLRHRAAFMWNFLAGADNLTMWTADLHETDRPVFADRAAFTALRTLHDALKPTPLFRAGTWLVACMALGLLAARRRDTPAGAFALGTCGSAALYVLTFFFVGVASDFRYAYWAVLASLAGAAALASMARERAAALKLVAGAG